VLKEMNADGISNQVIVKLLQDMEMLDENGEDIWGGGERR
jgi:hypothetical protein